MFQAFSQVINNVQWEIKVTVIGMFSFILTKYENNNNSETFKIYSICKIVHFVVAYPTEAVN